jgi:hypothetical protein
VSRLFLSRNIEDGNGRAGPSRSRYVAHRDNDRVRDVDDGGDSSPPCWRWRNARVLTAILYLNADGTGGETDAAAPTSAHVEGGGSQGPLPSSDPSSPLAWQADRDGGV